jgi:hypothetical protein
MQIRRSRGGRAARKPTTCRSEIVRTLAGAAFALLAGGAAAQQQCGPFEDVFGPGGICPAVTWLKNRAITLGCDATHYCPNQEVPRLQMAAFMKRLGDIMTPAVFTSEESGGALVLLNENILCKTAMVPTKSYRRLSYAQGSLSFEVTGTQELVAAVVSSTNGTNWTLHGNVARALVTNDARHHLQSLTPTQPISADTLPRQFGLLVQRTGNGGLNDLSTWTCNLQVIVVNGTEGAS